MEEPALYAKAGNETSLQNMTDFRWEQLLSMRDEVESILARTTDNKPMQQVCQKLDNEIERRLLKILN